MLLAIVSGTVVGAMIGNGTTGFFGLTILWTFNSAGTIFLTGARAFAVPLIVSSVILGAVGLEPMRGLGRLIWKTLGWIVFSSLLAALAGFVAVSFFDLRPEKIEFWQMDAGTYNPFWLGLILVSLAFGYYRNQIEEGHARLLARFCQGLDEMLTPFIQWAARLAPVGMFILTVPRVLSLREWSAWTTEENLPRVAAILTGWMIYGLALLPLLLWLFTRTNPWKYFRAMAPAVLFVLVSGSPEAALPLTFDRVRRVAGISNRVASVTLPLCAVLQCDARTLTGVVMAHSETFVWFRWAVYLGSAALAVFGHACAAAIIAHSEGERGLLSPPPPKDPLAFDDGPADGALS